MLSQITSTRLGLLAGLLLACLGLSAQETITFTPQTEPGCRAGQTITSTKELSWHSRDQCVTVELDADGNTLRIGPGDSQVGTVVTAMRTGAAQLRLTAPAGAGSEYALYTWFEDLQGNALDLDGEVTFLVGGEMGSLESYPLGAEVPCYGTLRAGEALDLLQLDFVNTLTQDQPVRLRYDWRAFEIGTKLTSIVVPESDFDGAGYVHSLPTGVIALDRSGSDVVYVNTAATKPVPQDIRLVKTEGAIVSMDYTILAPGSAANGEPHRVSLDLTDVEICLPLSGEIVIDTGVVLSLTRTQINYGSEVSCLALQGGDLRVPAQTALSIGAQGYGMQAFEGGRLFVGEGATLHMDCKIYLKGDGTRLLVDRGASVHVGANSTARRYDSRIKIKVELQPGATFDASAAPREVQQLFQVVQMVATPELLPASRFAAYPNPAPAGEATVTLASRGALAHAIVRVDLLDAVGRLVRADRLSGQATDFRHTLALPSAGVYTARLTDASGAVGHLRLVGQ